MINKNWIGTALFDLIWLQWDYMKIASCLRWPSPFWPRCWRGTSEVRWEESRSSPMKMNEKERAPPRRSAAWWLGERDGNKIFHVIPFQFKGPMANGYHFVVGIHTFNHFQIYPLLKIGKQCYGVNKSNQVILVILLIIKIIHQIDRITDFTVAFQSARLWRRACRDCSGRSRAPPPATSSPCATP